MIVVCWCGRSSKPGIFTDILPSLKRLNHSLHCIRFIQFSLYAWLSNWNVSVNFLPSLQQNFTHTRCSSNSFVVTLSLIRRTACARAQFSGCSSTTNDHSETGQMAVCCQNLPLGALSSRSAPSVRLARYLKSSVFFLTRLVCGGSSLYGKKWSIAWTYAEPLMKHTWKPTKIGWKLLKSLFNFVILIWLSLSFSKYRLSKIYHSFPDIMHLSKSTFRTATRNAKSSFRLNLTTLVVQKSW